MPEQIIEDRLMLKSIFACEAKKQDDGTYLFAGSDETEDRDGEVMKIDGWELANYKKNPVVLWAHNHATPAIGKAERVYKSDGKLKFKVRFAKEGTYDLADTVRGLVDDGIINAVSVGFIPKDRKYPTEGDKTPSIITTKAELYELSLCNVPANPNALRERMLEKGYSKEKVKEVLDEETDPITTLTVEDDTRLDDLIEAVGDMKTSIERIERKLFPDLYERILADGAQAEKPAQKQHPFKIG